MFGRGITDPCRDHYRGGGEQVSGFGLEKSLGGGRRNSEKENLKLFALGVERLERVTLIEEVKRIRLTFASKG